MSDISGLNQWLTSTDSVVSDCERMAEKIKEEKQRIRDALQQLESQSADVKVALDSVTAEINNLVDQMNDDDADPSTIQTLQSRVSMLQSQRSQMMALMSQLEQRKMNEREKQRKVEQNTEKLREYCHRAIASFGKKIDDCQQMIGRLQTASGMASNIATMRFGNSAQQLGRNTDSRVQQYQNVIQRCVSQRWRMEQVLNSLDDGEAYVRERTR